MGSKQRFTYIFVLMSLTVTMLFFQNCSPSGGLYDNGSETDDFIVDPPTIYTGTNSTCQPLVSTFKTTDTVYICINNAGTAPSFGFAPYNGAGYHAGYPVVVSTGAGWSSRSTGNWSIAFPGSNFALGPVDAYVTHTNDSNAFGKATLTITN